LAGSGRADREPQGDDGRGGLAVPRGPLGQATIPVLEVRGLPVLDPTSSWNGP